MQQEITVDIGTELFLNHPFEDDFFIMEYSEQYAMMADRGDMTLLKDISEGNVKAFEELMHRYLDLVSRTSFRVLCDRIDSEFVTEKVFIVLWHDVLDYDDSLTVAEWLLRLTAHYCRVRITRRHILRIFGVQNDLFVNVSPRVEDHDDYVAKQAWGLHCRITSHMTPLQSAVYAMCVLDGLSVESVSRITRKSHLRIESALARANEIVMSELRSYGRDKSYCRYNAFLRKVADSLTDYDRLVHEIFQQIGIK